MHAFCKFDSLLDSYKSPPFSLSFASAFLSAVKDCIRLKCRMHCVPEPSSTRLDSMAEEVKEYYYKFTAQSYSHGDAWEMCEMTVGDRLGVEKLDKGSSKEEMKGHSRAPGKKYGDDEEMVRRAKCRVKRDMKILHGGNSSEWSDWSGLNEDEFFTSGSSFDEWFKKDMEDALPKCHKETRRPGSPPRPRRRDTSPMGYREARHRLDSSPPPARPRHAPTEPRGQYQEYGPSYKSSFNSSDYSAHRRDASPPPRRPHADKPHQFYEPRTERRGYRPLGPKPPVCLYKLLGVSRSASQDDIKKAYRKLCLKWHPDRCSDKTVATKKIAEINEANDILVDERKKRFYDATGHITAMGDDLDAFA